MSTLGKKFPNRAPRTPYTAKPIHRVPLGKDPVEHVTLSLPPELRLQIDVRAGQLGETRSAYLRRLALADLQGVKS